jgi:ankyrin repeat protein
VEGTKTHLRATTSAASTPMVASTPMKAASKAMPANIGVKKSPAQKDPNNSLSILLKAALDDDVNSAKEALKKGADINGQDDIGYTPLQVAMIADSEKMIHFLIVEGANVNVRNKEGLTPLMLVAKAKLNLEYAHLIVDPGASDPDSKNKQGKTALDFAKESEYKELIDYLEGAESIQDYKNALENRKKRNKR